MRLPQMVQRTQTLALTQRWIVLQCPSKVSFLLSCEVKSATDKHSW
jgi:hypothetical protein